MPINAKYLVTWDLDVSKTQGMEAFGLAMGLTEEQSKMYATLKYSFTVTQDGDTYKLDIDFKGTVPNVSYSLKEGDTIDYSSPDGRKSKLTLTFEDGNPIEKYEMTEKNVTWSVKRTLEGDVMTAVTSFGDITMSQTLNKV